MLSVKDIIKTANREFLIDLVKGFFGELSDSDAAEIIAKVCDNNSMSTEVCVELIDSNFDIEAYKILNALHNKDVDEFSDAARDIGFINEKEVVVEYGDGTHEILSYLCHSNRLMDLLVEAFDDMDSADIGELLNTLRPTVLEKIAAEMPAETKPQPVAMPLVFSSETHDFEITIKPKAA